MVIRPVTLSGRNRIGRLVLLSMFVGMMFGAETVVAQGNPPDTVQTVQPDWLQHHPPKAALWRAAAVPGWGQIYNRQYYKLPFVYGGLAAIVGTSLYMNNKYLLYRHASLYKQYEERTPDENPYEKYKPDFEQIAQDYPNVTSEPLKQQRDIYRRNRDLSYFGIGLVYGLTVLDAYVAAQLLNFDVGEDLTLSMTPAYDGVSTRLTVRF